MDAMIKPKHCMFSSYRHHKSKALNTSRNTWCCLELLLTQVSRENGSSGKKRKHKQKKSYILMLSPAD